MVPTTGRGAHKPARRHKPKLTLDRALSRFGIASRADAAVMIRSGRVTIDGRRVVEPLTWVEPAVQRIRLDGRRLQGARKVYYALHKPRGAITSHGDPRGRATIYDLPSVAALSRSGRQSDWLFPVGRLDQDTSGLLLLTNDSVFAERITNPATKVAKTYLVKINGMLPPQVLDRLRAGLDIGRGESSGPAKVTWLRDNGRFCWIELEITEGKNRQVRRMIQALGYEVLKLARIRIGRLQLAALAPGELRPIRPADVFGGIRGAGYAKP
jgi:23S rRNA pseudouridine2605 synthase